MAPFDGLSPSPSIDHARWATDVMAGRTGVALIVPDEYDRYVRILHPLHDCDWGDLDPIYLQGATLETGHYPWPHPEPLSDVEGNLAAAAVDTLARVLRHHTTRPDRCHYAVWRGWGPFAPGGRFTVAGGNLESHPNTSAETAVHRFVERCAIHPWWGGRDMFLFDGPLDAVANIAWPDRPGTEWRQSPQWWWPEDRTWFIGTEIDDPWTYVAGSDRLIEQVAASPLNAIEVRAGAHW